MTRQSLGSLTLTIIVFLFNSLTPSQNPVRSSARLKADPLSQNELNQVAQKLSSLDLRQYAHRSYKPGDKGIPLLVRETTVRTLFLMRSREFMKALPDGFYDDKQGNLIFFGNFTGPQKVSIPYSLTFTPTAEVILAFDTDNNGVVDGMLGRRPGGTLWELRGNRSALFWRCLESRFQTGAFGAAFSCWQLPESGSGGNAQAPGSSPDAESFEGFVNRRANPDCPVFDTGQVRDEPDIAAAVVANPGTADALLCESMSDIARKRGDQTHDGGNKEAADHLYRGADHLRRAAVAHVNSADPSRSERDRSSDHAEYRRERSAFEREVREARRLGANTGGLVLPPAERQPRVRNTPRSRTPFAEYEDPRCAGRDTKNKQLGILSLAFNKDFCGDDDPITCIERASDPVRDASQGRCYHQPGPDDSRQLVCQRKGRESDSPSPLGPSEPPEPERGPADGAPLPFKIPRSVNYTFLETTPVGAMLAVRCTAGGGPFCPGQGDMKTPVPKP